MDENIKPKDPKKRKMKDDTKIGIAIAASAVLFFGCIFAIESGINNDEPVGGLVSNVSVPNSNVSTSTKGPDSASVYDPMKEYVNKPIIDAKLERQFYDASAKPEERLNAVITLPGEDTYAKSEGEDYASSTSFTVYASFSGKVIKTENNTLYGNVVWVEHDSKVVAIYASLGEVRVNQGQRIKQGDVIGTSGKSTFTSELGSETAHFELSRDDKPINPKDAYGEYVKNL